MSSWPGGHRPSGRTRPAARALALGLAVLVLGLAACSSDRPAPAAAPASSVPAATTSGPGPTVTADPSASRPAEGPRRPDSCEQLVRRLTLTEQVGQLVMVAVTSTGMTSTEEQAVRRSQAGSVLLLGNSTAGRAATADVVDRVRSAADSPARVEVMLAADQEGGRVQRLAGPGFATIPSAVRQSELSDAELTRAARGWGGQLDQAGVDADLAPVADVVPRELETRNEPVGQLHRGYGSSPATVAAKVRAFTTGMDRAGVATAVKHFPGLGRVRGNTDFRRRVVDRLTTRHDPALRGFEAAVAAGVDMVMVSSAVYPRIDRERPAVFSPTVLEGMIRDDLDFGGVVVSDDLSAAALRDYSPPRRALGFVGAGGDLMIIGDPASARPMARALVERGSRDRAFARRIEQSARRVLTLKDRRGLASC